MSQYNIVYIMCKDDMEHTWHLNAQFHTSFCVEVTYVCNNKSLVIVKKELFKNSAN